MWSLRFVSGGIRLSDIGLCSCEWGAVCPKPLGFYCYSFSCAQKDSVPHEIVSSLSLGCQLFDFRYSTLECVYNQSYVQIPIDEHIYSYENVYLPVDLSNITALYPNNNALTFGPG
ncbi:unnamed protein product, partial [Rotaria sp. Silwood2]